MKTSIVISIVVIIGILMTLPAFGQEIRIVGNSIEINLGDALPSSADYTHFGSADVNGEIITRTFTIYNDDDVNPLNLTGLVRPMNDFSVSKMYVTPVAPGDSTQLQIIFNPNATGLKQASVAVINDDMDESPYFFIIQGIGVGPEMAITGNGNEITDGDSSPSTTDDTDFGTVPINTGHPHTFTIQNTGDGDLTLTTPITVDDSGNFTVTNQPASPVAGPGTTTFTVQFKPNATGLKQASIIIFNDDIDENPYSFYVQGTGTNTAPTISEISDQTTLEDTPTPPIPFTVNDVSSAPSTLTVIGHSNNQALIPDANIDIRTVTAKASTAGSDRTVAITPASNANGATTITLTVSDGTAYNYTSFLLTVFGINDPPVFLAPLPPIFLNQGQHYGILKAALYPLVEDVDNPDPTLIWSIESHPHLTPTVTADSILFDAPTDWAGTATLTVTVSDGELSDTESLEVTVMESGSGIGMQSGIPDRFQLSQNIPNPFNPTTTIHFALPTKVHVNLTIYNTRGQAIQTLVDEVRDQGYHSVQWDATRAETGIYLFRIQAGDFCMVRKGMLIK